MSRKMLCEGSVRVPNPTSATMSQHTVIHVMRKVIRQDGRRRGNGTKEEERRKKEEAMLLYCMHFRWCTSHSSRFYVTYTVPSLLTSTLSLLDFSNILSSSQLDRLAQADETEVSFGFHFYWLAQERSFLHAESR